MILSIDGEVLEFFFPYIDMNRCVLHVEVRNTWRK
jgi:hypothetical protein